MWTMYTLRKYLLSRGFICVDPEVVSTEEKKTRIFQIWQSDANLCYIIQDADNKRIYMWR